MTDQLDQNVADHVHRLLFEELNLCCGFPEDAYTLIRDLLTAFRNKTGIDTLLPQPGARYLVLAALDDAGLIEHGSIIDAAWLSRKGEWYWQAMTRLDYDDIDGDGSGLPHDGKACMESCLKPFWGMA